MERIFVYLDPHFWHSNIIKYEDRPFSSVEDMNENLIKNYNNKVSNEDKGDISFAGVEKTKEIISKLNGYKILILGNYDRRKNPRWWQFVGFNEVYSWPIVYNGFIILSHEPVYVNNHMPYVNIHGHLYSKKYSDYFGYFNASCENTEYAPILLDDIVSKLMEENDEKQ